MAICSSIAVSLIATSVCVVAHCSALIRQLNDLARTVDGASRSAAALQRGGQCQRGCGYSNPLWPNRKCAPAKQRKAWRIFAKPWRSGASACRSRISRSPAIAFAIAKLTCAASDLTAAETEFLAARTALLALTSLTHANALGAAALHADCLLSQGQVQAARRIFDDVVDPAGEVAMTANQKQRMQDVRTKLEQAERPT